MTTDIRFLHTMRQADYLEQALREGLMFTDHKVTFKPFQDLEDAAERAGAYALPKLAARAQALGARDLNLSTLAAGLGSISGAVPMICFTEVHGGRDLRPHYLNFGAYGLVVAREWVERNGGDRVVYAGPRSTLTNRLHRMIVDLQIAGVHVKNGQALFDSNHLSTILDLFALIQRRDQLAEVEWRIAGEHGFMGGNRSTGRRLPLCVSDIEAVLVQDDEDVPRFEAILRSLPSANGDAPVPGVHRQPEALMVDDDWYRPKVEQPPLSNGA